jgi:hypothetical protein
MGVSPTQILQDKVCLSMKIVLQNPTRRLQQPRGFFLDPLPLTFLRLMKIFPGMRSRGEILSIPMPGHPVSPSDRDNFLSAVRRLEELVREHDVVFALTDSREARWLPTVMCSALNKVSLFILPFDTTRFLSMRH